MIPEPEPATNVPLSADASVTPARGNTRAPAEDVDKQIHRSVKREDERMVSPSRTPDTQHDFYEDSGIFPSVTLSPPSVQRPSLARSPSLSARIQPQHTTTLTTKKAITATSKTSTAAAVPTTNKPTKPAYTTKKATYVGKQERVESSVAYELDVDDDENMAGAGKAEKGKSVSRDSASASVTMRDSTSASRNSVTASASASRDTTSRSHSTTGTTPGTVTNSSNANASASGGTPTAAGSSRTRPVQPLARSPTSRYPTPPPADAPLGPAAQYPYLPASPSHLGDGGGPGVGVDGDSVPGHTGENILYSCRPGPGPYLFDLLSTLPLAEHGVLAWEVVDREDEIWESDDVREEYKVMHALWARWVFVGANRSVCTSLSSGPFRMFS